MAEKCKRVINFCSEKNLHYHIQEYTELQQKKFVFFMDDAAFPKYDWHSHSKNLVRHQTYNISFNYQEAFQPHFSGLPQHRPIHRLKIKTCSDELPILTCRSPVM